MSSVAILHNRTPKTYLHITFKIQNLLTQLSQHILVKIQYVPAHKDIPGNEMADLAAKAAHSCDTVEEIALSREEKVRVVEQHMREKWSGRLNEEIALTGKGLKMFAIKNNTDHWPWALHALRVVETSLARLRIGHVGLHHHLFRFNMSDSQFCECGEVESVEHFIMNCRLYQRPRATLFAALNHLHVEIALKNILGGGKYPSHIQHKVVNAVAQFLFDTGRMSDL